MEMPPTDYQRQTRVVRIWRWLRYVPLMMALASLWTVQWVCKGCPSYPDIPGDMHPLRFLWQTAWRFAWMKMGHYHSLQAIIESHGWKRVDPGAAP